MVAIPSEDAARAAWAALAPKVRAEVIRLAARGEGHPDPAVAAVAVARARAEQRWPWWRTAMLGVGLCLFWGECLALAALGGSIRLGELGGSTSYVNVRALMVMAAPAIAGFAVFAAALRLRTPGALPLCAEIVNLRVFLASPEASAAAPDQRYRPWLTPRRVAVATGLVLGTAAVLTGAIALMRLPLRIGRGLDSVVGGVLLLLLVFGGSAAVRRIRAPLRAKRMTVDPDGLRFDRRAPIPWTQISGITLSGPTAGWSNEDSVILWGVRDAPTVVTPLHSGPLPEETILAARSYIAAAQQAA